MCYSVLDLRPQLHFILQLVLASIVGIIMWQMQDAIIVDRWYELFLFSALGGFLYIFILAALGGFDKKDFNFFWTTLNPKAMTSYVGEELKRK